MTTTNSQAVILRSTAKFQIHRGKMLVVCAENTYLQASFAKAKAKVTAQQKDRREAEYLVAHYSLLLAKANSAHAEANLALAKATLCNARRVQTKGVPVWVGLLLAPFISVFMLCAVVNSICWTSDYLTGAESSVNESQ